MILQCGYPKHQRLIISIVQTGRRSPYALETGVFLRGLSFKVDDSYLLVDRGLCSNACTSSSSSAITLHFALEKQICRHLSPGCFHVIEMVFALPMLLSALQKASCHMLTGSVSEPLGRFFVQRAIFIPVFHEVILLLLVIERPFTRLDRINPRKRSIETCLVMCSNSGKNDVCNTQKSTRLYPTSYTARPFHMAPQPLSLSLSRDHLDNHKRLRFRLL